jgi:hypothetical protein
LVAPWHFTHFSLSRSWTGAKAEAVVVASGAGVSVVLLSVAVSVPLWQPTMTAAAKAAMRILFIGGFL